MGPTTRLNFNEGDASTWSLIQKASRFTVADLLAKHAKIRGDSIAVAFEGRQWSYKQLNEEANRFADSLGKLGIGRGDRVAIFSENSFVYCVAIYAAAKMGAILPALNLRVTERELKENIMLTTPQTILVSAGQYERLHAVLPGLSYVKRLVLLDDIQVHTSLQGVTYHYYDDLISRGSPEEIINDEIEMEDGLLILYTSGTTGAAKGAIVSHRAIIARSQIITAALGLTAADTFIAWGPMSHMASTEQLISIHSLGGKVIIMPGYDPSRIADLLEKEAVGWLILMPGVIQPLIDELKKRDAKIQGVKLTGDMADLVPREQLAELTTLLGAPFVNTYGSTEMGSPPATANLIPIGSTTYRLAKAESPYCQVRIVDENGGDLPDGVPGELIMRGPSLFSGYWNDAETNEYVFRDGWFHTGDVLVRNPDGTLDFVDRLKYMIKSGGENIYPAEVERVLKSFPGVEEVVVVRIQDDKWGEVPKAFIAVEREIDQAALIEHCHRHLVRYKVPKAITIIPLEQFPRNFMGKIMRAELEKLG